MTQGYDQLRNLMTREASKSDNQQAQPRYGLVESYDPEHNTVICSLLPERTFDGRKILTTWLQIVSPMVGNGWGIVSPLLPGDEMKPGDQVIMLPMYNSGTEYVVLGATFNKIDLVAKGPNDIGGADLVTEVGEHLLRSKSGTTMKFVDGNTLMIKGDYHKEEVIHIKTKGNDVEFTADGGVYINDNLTTKGNVSVGTGASGSFSTPTGQIVTVAKGIIISIV